MRSRPAPTIIYTRARHPPSCVHACEWPERIVTLEQRLRRTLESKARQAASDSLTRTPQSPDLRSTPQRRVQARAPFLGADLGVADRRGPLQTSQRSVRPSVVGDEVLRRLAATLRENLPREYDVIARIGGEEFAAILPHTSRDDAAVVAERLRSAIESSPIPTAVGKLNVTISVGVGSLLNRANTEPQTTLDVLDEADRSLV